MRGKPNEQHPPRQAATQLPKPYTQNKPPTQQVNQPQTRIARNHNRSTAPELSVSKHWGVQTGPTGPQSRPQPPLWLKTYSQLFGPRECPQPTNGPPRETKKKNHRQTPQWNKDEDTIENPCSQFWLCIMSLFSGKRMILSIFYQLFAFLLPKLHAWRYVYIVYIIQTKLKRLHNW